MRRASASAAHEEGAEAEAPGAAMHQQFGEVGAEGLVLLRREDELHRAVEPAIGLGDEEDALAARLAGEHAHCRNARPFCRVIGQTKFTDAPTSTLSTRRSTRPSALARGLGGSEEPRGRSWRHLQGEDHGVAGGLAADVAEGIALGEAHVEAVAGGKSVGRRRAERDLHLALQHPDVLVDDAVAAAGEGDARPVGKIDLDDSHRRAGICRGHLAADVAADRVLPDRLLGAPGEGRAACAGERGRKADTEAGAEP